MNILGSTATTENLFSSRLAENARAPRLGVTNLPGVSPVGWTFEATRHFLLKYFAHTKHFSSRGVISAHYAGMTIRLAVTVFEYFRLDLRTDTFLPGLENYEHYREFVIDLQGHRIEDLELSDIMIERNEPGLLINDLKIGLLPAQRSLLKNVKMFRCRYHYPRYSNCRYRCRPPSLRRAGSQLPRRSMF